MTRQEYKDHFYQLASTLSEQSSRIQFLAWDIHGDIIECGKDPMKAMIEIFHTAKSIMESAHDAIEKIAIAQHVEKPKI